MFSTEKRIRKPPFGLERDQNRRLLSHRAHLQEQCSDSSQTAARTDGENIGQSCRRNSLQMQKPDLCSIPGKNNGLCRVQWGARGAPVQVTAPSPNPEEANQVSQLSNCKRDHGAVFSILWELSSCTICNSGRRQAGGRGSLPTVGSGGPAVSRPSPAVGWARGLLFDQ